MARHARSRFNGHLNLTGRNPAVRILPMLKKKPQVQPEDTALELGEQLRRCRKEARLTMQYVADNAGLSVGFISQVERGLAAPSLSSLRSIARVLQRPISEFLEQPGSSTGTTRKSRRVSYRVADGSISYERLSANFPGSTLRSVIVHEPPGHRSEPISHEGEELFLHAAGRKSRSRSKASARSPAAGETRCISLPAGSTATWNHTGPGRSRSSGAAPWMSSAKTPMNPSQKDNTQGTSANSDRKGDEE